jgi:hypothetical protein
MAFRNTNVGRKFQGTPLAKNTHKPSSLGSTAMEQSPDSGGNRFNPVQKPQANLQNMNIPVTGGQPPAAYPGMNTGAVGNSSLGNIGAGRVSKKKVAVAKPSFYGK